MLSLISDTLRFEILIAEVFGAVYHKDQCYS